MIPSCLLLVLGVLGAADILFFHTLRQGIRKHPGARAELVTHFLRGPTYCLLFLVVPNLVLGGWAFAGLLLLLLVDLGISLADFWLEWESRRDLGGLPRGEYLLHVLLAMLFGALVAAILYEEGHRLGGATGIAWRREGAPLLLRVALGVMAPLVLWTGLADLRAVLRLGRSRP